MPNFPEIFYWLAALHIEEVGPVRLAHALNQLGHIEAIFSANDNALLAAGMNPKQIQSLRKINWRGIEKEATWCEKNSCTIIHLNDDRYPPLLKEIHDPPMVLFVKGMTEVLKEPQLAIVGSRHPSNSGKELAFQFAQSLSEAGLIITSGLALGIDAVSHKGALKSQKERGKTIAVLGTGMKHIYPASNRLLAEEVIREGALISEFPIDMPPIAHNFPRRNRIISGLSLGVLIVEAALKSGSLITARFALEHNREVFAIPGSLHNPLARGCHELIRQGAKLTETAEDILEEIGWVPLKSPQKKATKSPAEPFLDYIDYEKTPLDVILARSGLTPGEVSSILLSLELKGYVKSMSGGYVRVALYV